MTNSLKYGLIALAGITLLFLYNKSSQKSYTLKAETIFDGKSEIINRIVISENEQILELVKNDSIWSITGNDSFVVTISISSPSLEQISEPTNCFFMKVFNFFNTNNPLFIPHRY